MIIFQSYLRKEKIFAQRMRDNVMTAEFLTWNYYMMLMSRDPNAFTQLIDIIIETKRNIIVNLLLNTISEIK